MLVRAGITTASSGFGDSDVDVFFWGMDLAEATRKLQLLLQKLHANRSRVSQAQGMDGDAGCMQSAAGHQLKRCKRCRAAGMSLVLCFGSAGSLLVRYAYRTPDAMAT